MSDPSNRNFTTSLKTDTEPQQTPSFESLGESNFPHLPWNAGPTHHLRRSHVITERCGKSPQLAPGACAETSARWAWLSLALPQRVLLSPRTAPSAPSPHAPPSSWGGAAQSGYPAACGSFVFLAGTGKVRRPGAARHRALELLHARGWT